MKTTTVKPSKVCEVIRGVTSIALGEIMATRSGSVDPSKFPEESFDLYSIPAYDSGQPDVAVGRNIGSAKQIVHPGDVLLSRIVPHIRRAWVVGKDRGRRLIASGEWIVFRSDKFDPNYLRHVLVGEPFYGQFMQTVSGVGGSLLRARPAQVADIEIPLPSLSEQQRAAGQLEQADRLRRTRRYGLELSDTFLPAAFLQLFGDATFPHAALEELATKERNSFVNGPFGSDLLTSELTDSGVPVIYIRDISSGRYERTSSVFVRPAKAAELEFCNAKPGDVLVAKVGDPPGIAAIYPAAEPDGIVTQDVIRVRPNTKVVSASYLQGFLNSWLAHREMTRIMVEGTRLRFSLGQFKDISILVPPLPLQQKFAALVEWVERLRSVQRESLRQSEHLFQSLLHNAFNKEL
jgi:type I restriction enzyme S subunit